MAEGKIKILKSISLVLLFLLSALCTNSQETGINTKISNDSFTIFHNTTYARIKNDYVLLEATPNDIMYLFYPVSSIKMQLHNASAIRKYFWKNYLAKQFLFKKLDSLLSPDVAFTFTEGYVYNKTTNDSCYLITDTLLENTGKPNATVAFSAELISSPYGSSAIIVPTGNKHISFFYRQYNRFIVSKDALPGNWEDVVYSEKYNAAPGYMHGSRKTYFHFNKDSNYNNIQTVYVGRNMDGLSRAYDFRGTYKITDRYIFLSNRKQGKTEKFIYWFEAIGKNEKLLHLKNEKGEHYKLLKQPDAK